MSLADWNLEALEEVAQREEQARQKAERLREERAEEEYHERRHTEKCVPFPVGSKVNRSGYHGIVTEVRNKEQRYVRLESGDVCVDVHDLSYW